VQNEYSFAVPIQMQTGLDMTPFQRTSTEPIYGKYCIISNQLWVLCISSIHGRPEGTRGHLPQTLDICFYKIPCHLSFNNEWLWHCQDKLTNFKI